MNYFSYYSEIEEHFVRRRKKNVLISPLDWSLIHTWKEMGVPLHVVLRGIDRAFDQFDARPVKTRMVNSLFYCQQAVQECFAEHTESRVGEGAEPSPERPLIERDETEALLEGFSQALYRAHGQAFEKQMVELAGVFERALVRVSDLREALPEEGPPDAEILARDLDIVDQWVTDAIQANVDPGTVEQWRREAARELRPYKKRVPPEMFEKILGNYLRRLARQKFELPALALFEL